MNRTEARSLIGKDVHKYVQENNLDMDEFLDNLWDNYHYFCSGCGLIFPCGKELGWNNNDGEKDPLCKSCREKELNNS